MTKQQQQEKVIKILKEGRARIQDNWVQGTYHNSISGGYCAVGAVTVANDHIVGNKIRVSAWNYLLAAMPKKYAGMDVEEYNDEYVKTKAPIIKLYNRAIKAAEDDLALIQEQSEGKPLPPIEMPVNIINEEREMVAA